MRTMRFPVPIHDYETIPGALAKGVRDNVLERANIFFDDAGLARRRVGFTQMMPAPDLERLATFLQCDPGALISRAGSIFKLAGRAATVHFGDLHLYLTDIDLAQRRVAPNTLRRYPYHREAWLFTLLPYCPVSLERLVHKCSACDTGIAWSRCWGIDICEWCRNPIKPSTEPKLSRNFAKDYRLFANLLSLQESVRRAAILQLPSHFQGVAPGSIVTMALRLGQACRPEPLLGNRRESIPKLPSPLIASVIRLGMAMLRGWPDSIMDWRRSKFDEQGGDLAGHHRIRAQIKRLGNPRLEDEAQARLIREALSNEFDSFVHSAASGRVVTAAEVMRRTSVNQKKLDLIREKLEDHRLPSIKRVRSQFNIQRVTEFEEAYRTSVPLRHLTFQLMLPTYALEQMVCLDVIPQELNEAVSLARQSACVQQEGFELLVKDLRCKKQPGEAPDEAIPIRAAARQIGGREKPWGAIFDALREGEMEFWMSSDVVSSRTILIRPSSLFQFQHVIFPCQAFERFPFTTTANGAEAEEILNIGPKYLPKLIGKKLLSFSTTRGVNILPKSEVLELAHAMVSPAELGFAWGKSSHDASRDAASLKVRRWGCGWSRDDLVARGLLRSVG